MVTLFRHFTTKFRAVPGEATAKEDGEVSDLVRDLVDEDRKRGD